MSELADELQMDVGNMSRQVRLYYRLQDRDRPGRLDPQAIDDFYAAHALVTSRTVKNYPQALKQVLGLSDAPVPAAVVTEIKQSLEDICDSQVRTEKRLNNIAKHFKLLLDRLDKQSGCDGVVSEDKFDSE
ncbi:hypothetical protein [Deinococcus aerolatus]|nr:hypothetical protein [Deinococcus aerolatus]